MTKRERIAALEAAVGELTARVIMLEARPQWTWKWTWTNPAVPSIDPLKVTCDDVPTVYTGSTCVADRTMRFQ